ncbi:MAG TPA: hypothetical protein VEG30_08130 [Terriglobales bacterium]|nr:hypothetical protein [Terriglobales bacterium]
MSPQLKALRSRVVTGSLILLASSGLVSLMNLAYNIGVARLLGPVGFGHATAVYTLLMLVSALTLSFQILCAKLTANHASSEEKAAVYFGLHGRAWRLGAFLAFLLVLFREVVSSYLRLPSATLVVLLALGTAFYIPLGARRGFYQGTYAFGQLGINFLLEGVVRLGGALLLIKAGMGVSGAVLASVLAVMMAYIFSPPRGIRRPQIAVVTSFREALQAIVFFVGQVVINNFDIVLVKHFFAPALAGLYAAVALVGRVVQMCSWSVVSTMFPVSAGSPTKEHEGRPVLITSLVIVIATLTVLIIGIWLMPSFLWRMIFGAHFEVVGAKAISSLLVLYAVTTGIYSLSAVMIAYEMSLKIANTGWLQLAVSGVLVVGIYLFHNSLAQVIAVQLVLMLLLLIMVLLPFVRSSLTIAVEAMPVGVVNRIRKRGRLCEPEVIAEFLRNEFHHPEFDPYRQRLGSIVSNPDLSSQEENELRRALLFLRRGAMWRELPPDTEWYEVDLAGPELERVRVFPRAHWRRIAHGSFYLLDIVERIHGGGLKRSYQEFLAELRRLGRRLQEPSGYSAILFIGDSEQSPITILDGNHRMAAAMLVSPIALQSFRFICGFSSRMRECCWYETNMTTLWRYAKNKVKHIPYDPESDINRMLQSRACPAE